MNTPPWLVTPEKIEQVIREIIEIGHPRQIILFGSYITGDMDINSDLDVLVICDDSIENTRNESVRIRKALRGILMPMDILVVRESHYNQLKDGPGLIYQEIARTGKAVYSAD